MPTHLIGNDAFQECDTVGITRPCTKHNYLVKRIEDLPRVLHEAFHIASSGRPGPVVVDIPKDIQFAKGHLFEAEGVPHTGYKPKLKGDLDKIKAGDRPDGARQASAVLHRRRRHQFRHARPASSCANSSSSPAYPITSTLMGLGAFPAADPQWLGMLGMHGTLRGQHGRCTIAT